MAFWENEVEFEVQYGKNNEQTNDIILKIRECGGSVYYSKNEKMFKVKSSASCKNKILKEVNKILGNNTAESLT